MASTSVGFIFYYWTGYDDELDPDLELGCQLMTRWSLSCTVYRGLWNLNWGPFAGLEVQLPQGALQAISERPLGFFKVQSPQIMQKVDVTAPTHCGKFSVHTRACIPTQAFLLGWTKFILGRLGIRSGLFLFSGRVWEPLAELRKFQHPWQALKLL